ncbi:MAG: GDSL-type esterase/lipase family protein [Fuerstiella sp.]
MTKTRPGRISVCRRAVYSLVVFGSFWLVVEATLRIIGFRYATSVETMVFTFPIDEYNRNSEEPFLQRDTRLFWKPKPHVLGHNSRGMVGPEFQDSKPDGVYRIVCLGDSCTHFGPDSYPEKLQRLLDDTAEGRFEVINAGCIGYSSFQGLTLLREKVMNWNPDLITVYFGWNDHWLARGRRDSQQHEARGHSSGFSEHLQPFRTWQFLLWGKSLLAAPAIPESRVLPDEYAANLRAIADICSADNVDFWLLTAPHAFEAGIPDYLRTSGEVADPEHVAELHESYNDIVRTVAEDLDAVCIDLASEFETMDKRWLFLDDHIHLSESGRLLVAKRMQEELRRRMEPDPSRSAEP